jgi:phosphoribosylformylglycinamidine (FGAM) synthase-like amidotransferase family enzyme
MQTNTKHPLLTNKFRRVPFVKPVLGICNNIRFLRKASLLRSFGWLPLLLYERILNYINFVAS